MTTIEERLHLLECLSKELEHRCREIADVALAELRDRDRIDRWHATYNAAYPYYAAATYSRSRLLSDNMNAAHEGARDAADLAHGPLETKAPVYPDGKFMSAASGWAAWDAKVEALVKAALVVIQQSTAKLSTPFANALDALEEASKPFEEKEI